MNKILFSTAIFLAGCSGESTTSRPAAVSEETGTERPVLYCYEPAVSELKGTLTSQVYWGPPGYGEDTLTDEKEKEYVLVLDKPIRIQKPDSDLSDGYNAALAGVRKIQLVHQQKLENYLNKPVLARGTLFGAQTGHHHTEVLMDLKEIK